MDQRKITKEKVLIFLTKRQYNTVYKNLENAVSQVLKRKFIQIENQMTTNACSGPSGNIVTKSPQNIGIILKTRDDFSLITVERASECDLNFCHTSD